MISTAKVTVTKYLPLNFVQLHKLLLFFLIYYFRDFGDVNNIYGSLSVLQSQPELAYLGNVDGYHFIPLQLSVGTHRPFWPIFFPWLMIDPCQVLSFYLLIWHYKILQYIYVDLVKNSVNPVVS